jgi:hypothetical protein
MSVGEGGRRQARMDWCLAARGIIRRVAQELGKAHPVDLCQRDRLQEQIARPKRPVSAFHYDTYGGVQAEYNLRQLIFMLEVPV